MESPIAVARVGTPEPRVSVVMAVNRDTGYLGQAIDSILKQTFTDFEFIIVANACADDLWARLHEFQDPRIRLFRTAIGQLAFNLNYGLDRARGTFVARMDADDVSLPDRLERQVRFLQARPDVGVLGTSCHYIDSQGSRCSREVRWRVSDAEIRSHLRIGATFVHSSVMFRRDLALQLRGYAGIHAEDWDLWLRIRRLSDQRFEMLPEPLVEYRLHGDQMTSDPTYSFVNAAGILVREFLITKDPVFLAGVLGTHQAGYRITRRLAQVRNWLLDARRRASRLGGH